MDASDLRKTDQIKAADQIKEADIVYNTNGRDAGQLFFVLREDGEYAEIADGRCRLIEKPKRKKKKHLLKVEVPETRTRMKILEGEKTTNAELRRTLRDINAENPSAAASGNVKNNGGVSQIV